MQNVPRIFQNIDGVDQPVAGQFVLEGDNQIGFSVGNYDTSRTLVIDPVLIYSTYLGGIYSDRGILEGSDATGVAVDSAGELLRDRECAAA